jgi:uncharacterized membrane protein YbhN (UPF0104 family)
VTDQDIQANPWRARALNTARLVFVVAVLAAVVYTVVKQWTQVRETFASLAWPSLALSLVMVLAGLGAQTLAWRAALADLGHRVPVRTAGQIYLIGLLAKYLPGSLWSFVLQMELGRRANVTRARAFLAGMVGLALSTTAALVLGAAALPVLFRAGGWITILLLTLAPISLVCAHPAVLTWLTQRFLRLTRRPPLDRPLRWRGVATVTGWSAVAWVCFGVHLWLLASTAAAPGLAGLVRCVGAFALALTAGIFAFLSPSGLGVREAIITAALLPYVPPGVALGIALASRVIFTIGDLLAAGLAALAGWRSTGRLLVGSRQTPAAEAPVAVEARAGD